MTNYAFLGLLLNGILIANKRVDMSDRHSSGRTNMHCNTGIPMYEKSVCCLHVHASVCVSAKTQVMQINMFNVSFNASAVYEKSS